MHVGARFWDGKSALRVRAFALVSKLIVTISNHVMTKQGTDSLWHDCHSHKVEESPRQIATDILPRKLEQISGPASPLLAILEAVNSC